MLMRRCVVAGAVCVSTAAPLRAQETHIRGFVDVTARAGENTGEQSAFALGQYVMHIVSHVADKVDFLGESVFEWDDATQDFGVDVERVLLTYSGFDKMRISVGKHHTPIGYWNNAYHHGTLLQPTIGRPLLMRFEDDGGPLPIHTTGIQVWGRDVTSAHLGYDVLLGNGIGGTPESDNNAAKSLTTALHMQVTPDLRIGGSAYFDHLSPGTPAIRGGTLTTPLTERMFGGYGAYFGGRLEAVGEYEASMNTVAGTTTTLNGAFLYAGYRTGRFVPYLLAESTKSPATDPYYGLLDVVSGTLGARYEYAPSAVFKLELRQRHTPGIKDAFETEGQFAIGF